MATYQVEKHNELAVVISGVAKVVVGTSVAGQAFNNLVLYSDEGEQVLAIFAPDAWFGIRRLTDEEFARWLSR